MVQKNELLDREIVRIHIKDGLLVHELVEMFSPVYSEGDIHDLLDRDAWQVEEISKFKYSTKQSVHLMEAFEVFEDLVYDLCMTKIVKNDERDHFNEVLQKFKRWKNDEELKVEQAKEFPINNLVSQFSSEEKEIGFYRNIKCILHEDSTASMKLYQNNTYYCFGCNQGGDVIDLLMKKRGVDFISAVKWLTNS
jgi:hypothetical protein